MKSPDRSVTLTTWLLRLIGGSICLSLVPIFIPLSWMSAIHAWLGLGSIPEQPIFEYLARSVSAMYFAHGCIVLVASTDVRRFLPLIYVISGLNVFLGSVLLFTDFIAPMPLFWTLMEGPPIITVGLLLFWLAGGVSR